MPMQDKRFGRGGKGKDKRNFYGHGQWWPQQRQWQQWPPQQQWGQQQQWPTYKGDKGAGRGGKEKGKDKGNKGKAADQVQSLKEKAKAAQAEYKQVKDAAEYYDRYPRQHSPPQQPLLSSEHTAAAIPRRTPRLIGRGTTAGRAAPTTSTVSPRRQAERIRP